MNFNFTKCIFLTSLILCACSSNGKYDYDQQKNGNEIVGTWQLIEWSDLDTIAKTWVHPYGKNARAYITYTSNNIMHWSLYNEKFITVSLDSLDILKYSYGGLLNNSVGYFGGYTIDYDKSIITHQVKGGSYPSYIGTDQPRPFTLNGDTLILGDNIEWKRVFVKVDSHHLE